MKRLIVVHGLKRSGNHAIIGWLRAHGGFDFFNNIVPIGPILRGESVIPPPVDFTLWLEGKLRARHSWAVSRLRKLLLARRSVIVSLEDHDLELRPFRDVPCEVINILILREPRNLLASRIRKSSLIDHLAYPRASGPGMQRVIELWKSHAREYLGWSDYLQQKVCIHFDTWFSSREYRQCISGELGLDFSDRGFSQVSKSGGGSSFGGTRFDGRNRKMDVLSREDHLTDIELQLLESAMADDELQELARRIDAMNGALQVP
jgi:hypothetical protein